MNPWENAVVTNKGLSLLAKMTAGNSITITRAEAGSGYMAPGLLQSATAVIDPQQELSFRNVTYPEIGKCAMPCSLKNEGLTTGYIAKQVGIYAVDPDEGEVLFFIAQSLKEKGTEVPSETEMPGYTAEWTFYFQYGQADGVNVTVDPSNAITQIVMEEYIAAEIQVATYADIDEALGLYGDIGDGSGSEGGTGSGSGSGSSSGTGVGTLDHSQLYNRNAANQHTIGAITGLEAALATAEGAEIDATNVETAWTTAYVET